MTKNRATPVSERQKQCLFRGRGSWRRRRRRKMSFLLIFHKYTPSTYKLAQMFSFSFVAVPSQQFFCSPLGRLIYCNIRFGSVNDFYTFCRQLRRFQEKCTTETTMGAYIFRSSNDFFDYNIRGGEWQSHSLSLTP
jgi:hypothetical protein